MELRHSVLLDQAIGLWRTQREGSREGALAILELLIDHYPLHPALWGFKGLVLSAHQAEEAARCFKRALALNPRAHRASMALATLLWTRGDYEASIDEAERHIGAQMTHWHDLGVQRYVEWIIELETTARAQLAEHGAPRELFASCERLCALKRRVSH